MCLYATLACDKFEYMAPLHSAASIFRQDNTFSDLDLRF